MVLLVKTASLKWHWRKSNSHLFFAHVWKPENDCLAICKLF